AGDPFRDSISTSFAKLAGTRGIDFAIVRHAPLICRSHGIADDSSGRFRNFQCADDVGAFESQGDRDLAIDGLSQDRHLRDFSLARCAHCYRWLSRRLHFGRGADVDCFQSADSHSRFALHKSFFSGLGLAALFWSNRTRDRRGVHCKLRPGAARRPTPTGGHVARIKFMKGDISLCCRDLERYLGEAEERVHALRGVSLDVEAGSLHAVVGPSGCGKSTLLYILGLLDVPDAGSVKIGSTLAAGLRDEELARQRNELIGFIFQFHFLMEEFTAQENVMIPMRRLGQLSEEEMGERAANLLEAVDLGGKLRRQSRHLSGGEQQRVAIARALANDPQVILADEPTGNLDTNNSQRAFDLLANIVREREKALLLVTHNRFIA